jgi:hypothetical protein
MNTEGGSGGRKISAFEFFHHIEEVNHSGSNSLGVPGGIQHSRSESFLLEQDTINGGGGLTAFQLLEVNRCKKTDERDAIQKKTFTKWVNKHLIKSNRRVDDLFVDLRDGFSLIALLEALSGETLPRENGYTRFHRIQNVQYVLEFLKKKNIKVVNIRPEDIVEGNGKLTLGLIWTIILNFQVSVIKLRQQQEALARAAALSHTGYNNHSGDAVLLESTTTTSSYYHQKAKDANAISSSATSQSVVLQVSEVLAAQDGMSAKEALLQWARKVTQGYPGVNVTNFTNSWRDGLAFNAILHRYRPNLINWNKISDPNTSARERLDNAFEAADKEFGVSKLLDAEDVDVDKPDEKSLITYVSSLYNALPPLDELSKYQIAATNYLQDAKEWLEWIKNATELMYEKELPTSIEELEKLINQLNKFQNEDLPPMNNEREKLKVIYAELVHAFNGTNFLHVPQHLQPQGLDSAWQELMKAMEFRYEILHEQLGIQVNFFTIFLQFYPFVSVFFLMSVHNLSCPLKSSYTNPSASKYRSSVQSLCIQFYLFPHILSSIILSINSKKRALKYLVVKGDDSLFVALYIISLTVFIGLSFLLLGFGIK